MVEPRGCPHGIARPRRERPYGSARQLTPCCLDGYSFLIQAGATRHRPARGELATVRATLPEIARNSGHLVFVSSVYAFQSGAGVASYAMSKAAVKQLGRALRLEH